MEAKVRTEWYSPLFGGHNLRMLYEFWAKKILTSTLGCQDFYLIIAIESAYAFSNDILIVSPSP